jgi:hypothetical protein
MSNEPKTRKPRTKRDPEFVMTAVNFAAYPGLLDWVTAQSYAHTRTPAEEIVYRLKLAWEMDKRRGAGGRLA